MAPHVHHNQVHRHHHAALAAPLVAEAAQQGAMMAEAAQQGATMAVARALAAPGASVAGLLFASTCQAPLAASTP